VRAVRNLLVLYKTLGEIDPDLFDGFALALPEAMQQAKSQGKEPPGFLAILNKFRSKDLRRGLVAVNSLLEAWGKDFFSKHTRSRANKFVHGGYMRTTNRWVIAAAGVFLQIALGAVYAWSVFRTRLPKQFGWSIPEVTFTFTIKHLRAGDRGFLRGLWLNRRGPRIVALTGGVLYGLGVSWLAFPIMGVVVVPNLWRDWRNWPGLRLHRTGCMLG